jgi:trk system potassium uptake protein TrkH
MISSITTTGFNSYQPIIMLGPSVIFMSSVLMMFGGALGSTAGGIKQLRVASTLKGVYYSLLSRISSKRIIRPRFYHRYGEEKELTDEYYSESVSFVVLYILALFVGTVAITILPLGIGFDDAFFEVASAVTGTGLSVGITHAAQHPAVLWILAVVMFIGRLEIIAVYYSFLRLSRDILRKETV